MGPFSRKKQTDEQRVVPEASPIRAFWQWWASSGRQLHPTGASEATQTLHELLLAIHPSLTWHFGPGRNAEHRLTVSAGGSPEGRPILERWYRAAPAVDAVWEFGKSIEADPSALHHDLRIGDVEVSLSQTQFAIETGRDERRVHVQVYHPQFSDLTEDVRMNVSLMVMEWAVGEDDLERWIGAVEPVTEAPTSPATDADIRAAVATLKSERDPEGWLMLQGQGETGEIIRVTARSGVRWLDRPELDMHHVISVQFNATEDALPVSVETADKLNAFEDEVMGVVEPGGIFMAAQTVNNVRMLHAYTDSEDQNATDEIVKFAKAYDFYHDAELDPGWSQVRPFTG